MNDFLFRVTFREYGPVIVAIDCWMHSLAEREASLCVSGDDGLVADEVEYIGKLVRRSAA